MLMKAACPPYLSAAATADPAGQPEHPHTATPLLISRVPITGNLTTLLAAQPRAGPARFAHGWLRDVQMPGSQPL